MSDIFVFDNEHALSSKFFKSVKKQYHVGAISMDKTQSFDSIAFSKKLIVAVPLQASLESDRFSKSFISNSATTQ